MTILKFKILRPVTCAAGCLLLCLALFGPATAFSQTASPARLVVNTDLKCRLSIDGGASETVSVGEAASFTLPAGDHHLVAIPAAGGPRWEQDVTVSSQQDQNVTIGLRQMVVSADVQRRGYWVAPDRHLIWAAADNGSGVTFEQAEYYCRNLNVSGLKDWRLASIDDLQNLFGGPADELGHHVTGPLRLTGWVWSGSTGKHPGEHWALDFGDGGRASVVEGDSGLNRALCVRRGK
jgi:hypothetical protein